MSLDWDYCDHEWSPLKDSQFHSEGNTDVRCTKCGCPGDQDNRTGDVYWPAT